MIPHLYHFDKGKFFRGWKLATMIGGGFGAVIWFLVQRGNA